MSGGGSGSEEKVFKKSECKENDEVVGFKDKYLVGKRGGLLLTFSWYKKKPFLEKLIIILCLLFLMNQYYGRCYRNDNQLEADIGTSSSKTLADYLNETQVTSQGFFNSFQLSKRAFVVKLKVKHLVLNNEVDQTQPATVMDMGLTPFRKQFLNRTGLGSKGSLLSANYVSDKLQSQPLSLNEKVLFSKYPAIREPPGSFNMHAEESYTKEYIYEYVGVCPYRLVHHILVQEKLKLSELDKNKLDNWAKDSKMKVQTNTDEKPPQYELINIVNSGPPENRIDVVFMGDGYTLEERASFIEDMTRLSTEMFEGETFLSWLPLINVWAVFVPSAESGIGSGGKPKNTPFGLYRDGTELRGIYTSKPGVARSICKHLGPELCDFPSMIANDDFYGGLGGEFIISTRSILSGTVVLRHEMGHTFNEVGEEYDGGEVYEGANAALKLNQIPWKHWLTDLANENESQVIELGSSNKIKEEKNSLAVQDYSWHDLSKLGPYTLNFNSSGKFSRWYLQISTSGMDKKGSFKAYLDDKKLHWKPPGTIDRTFSTWFNATHGLSKGSHQLRFEAKRGLPEGKVINQLCNVELVEYAKEGKFGWEDPLRVGAYPTYNYKRKKSYRPTNEFCLMRNMTSHHFCPVCAESLWLKFLDRISLLDELDISLVKLNQSHLQTKHLVPQPDHTQLSFLTEAKLTKTEHKRFTLAYYVEAKLINLANNHFELGSNSDPASPKYALTWFHNAIKVNQLDNETSFLVPDISPYAIGVWDVSITFSTPQVRKDPNHLLTSKETFILKQAY